MKKTKLSKIQLKFLDTISRGFWSPRMMGRTLDSLAKRGLVWHNGQYYETTELGHAVYAKQMGLEAKVT